MKKLLLLFFIVLTTINLLSQEIPKQISYQGVLKTSAGTIVPNGNYSMIFKVYNDATGGSAIWTETQTIAIENGIFSVYLGSVTPISGVPFDRVHYLGIALSGDPELLPRTMFTPSPYSFLSMNVLNNSISSSKIADGTIANSDLADNSVNSEKISDESGYNYNNNGNSNLLIPLTSAGQPFASVVLEAPASGFAIVTINTKVFVTHTSGEMDNVILKISTVSGDISTPSYNSTVTRIPALFPTCSDAIAQSVSHTVNFPVNPGSNTFYLNAYMSGGASGSLLTPQITAIFIPTRYGTGAKLNEATPVTNEENHFLGK